MKLPALCQAGQTSHSNGTRADLCIHQSVMPWNKAWLLSRVALVSDFNKNKWRKIDPWRWKLRQVPHENSNWKYPQLTGSTLLRWQQFGMGSQKELKTIWFLPPRRQQTWIPDLPDMKTKYTESERKGNHQHHSFVFNINWNMQNLSSLLQTNEWLIPFAAATLTTTASERNNVKKKKSISIMWVLCPQHPPAIDVWQMIRENFWKVSHHRPKRPLCNYHPKPVKKTARSVPISMLLILSAEKDPGHQLYWCFQEEEP